MLLATITTAMELIPLDSSPMTGHNPATNGRIQVGSEFAPGAWVRPRSQQAPAEAAFRTEPPPRRPDADG